MAAKLWDQVLPILRLKYKIVLSVHIKKNNKTAAGLEKSAVSFVVHGKNHG